MLIENHSSEWLMAAVVLPLYRQMPDTGTGAGTGPLLRNWMNFSKLLSETQTIISQIEAITDRPVQVGEVWKFK